MNHCRLVSCVLVWLSISACQDDLVRPIELDPSLSRVLVGVQVTRIDAAPGDTIGAAVAIDGASTPAVGAVQGYVRFDPARLRYVGQIPIDGTLAVINPGQVRDGELRVLSFKVGGLEDYTSGFAFEVLRPDYVSEIRYELEVAAATTTGEVALTVAPTTLATNDLPLLDALPTALTTEQLVQIAGFTLAQSDLGPLRVLPSTVQIGDCDQDLDVDAVDLVAVANIAVGTTPPPTDPNELRVCDADGSGVVNVVDVVDVSRFAVGVSTILAPVGMRYDPLVVTSRTACALDSTGAAYCWGRNNDGLIGDGTVGLPRPDPTLVSGGITFVQLVGGAFHTCGLDTTGQAYCWGTNDTGQLGDGSLTDAPAPVAVTGGHVFVTLSSTVNDHVCGIEAGGAAWCWGMADTEGRLGDGVSVTSQPTPVAVAGGIAFADISTGESHTCALNQLGQAYCWGDNGWGQLGNGSFVDSPTPVAIAVGQTFVEIVAGGNHTCALDQAGQAYCWGSNNWGELGDATSIDKTTPVPVTGGLAFVRIAAAWQNVCGIVASGQAYCWGEATDGLIGDGTEGLNICTSGACRPVPTAVSGGHSFTVIDGGGNQTCGVENSGQVWCWGSNHYGQLGVGGGATIAPRYGPSSSISAPAFAEVSVGYTHSCGRESGGGVSCWGLNDDGELGNGTTVDANAPSAVTGGVSFSSIDVGSSHTCGIDGSQNGYCWGGNTLGALGDGTELQRTQPVAVTGGHALVAIRAGSSHSCATTSNGVTLCWGSNTNGQSGNGTTGGAGCSGSCLVAPDTVDMSLFPSASLDSLRVGAVFSCGLDAATGQAYCWGRNGTGSVGDGSFINRNSPTPVSQSGQVFTRIFSTPGGSHACALTAAGAAWCWGANPWGEVGDGTVNDAPAPVQVTGGHTFQTLGLGPNHTCGIDSGGALLCWGENFWGQLGDGTTTDRLQPTAVVGGSGFVDIELGFNSTCGIDSSAVVYCWGYNGNGRLGLGHFTRSLVPVAVAPF